jgi:hypothetical protein
MLPLNLSAPKTHCVVLLTDGASRAHLFDPNGAHASTAYLIRGLALSSPQICLFLSQQTSSGSTLRWTSSTSGVQRTLREPTPTAFVPNKGFCMFLCRTLLLLLDGGRLGGGRAEGLRDPISVAAKFELTVCGRGEMGKAALRALQQRFPFPARTVPALKERRRRRTNKA